MINWQRASHLFLAFNPSSLFYLSFEGSLAPEDKWTVKYMLCKLNSDECHKGCAQLVVKQALFPLFGYVFDQGWLGQIVSWLSTMFGSKRCCFGTLCLQKIVLMFYKYSCTGKRSTFHRIHSHCRRYKSCCFLA